MPDLIIVIPFAPDQDCDLDRGATDMKVFFDKINNHRLGEHIGAEINGIVIAYKDDDVECEDGDYVILFAHGAEHTSTLYNNVGQEITMEDALEELTAIRAQTAERVLFMCCYSAREDHIGRVWKDDHEDQATFGGEHDIATLYSATRTQIKTVCFALHEIAP